MEDDALLGELPQLMLAAEMEGVPGQFTSLRLDRELQRLERPLRDLFHLPVLSIALEMLPEPQGNLVPSAWQADHRRIERSEQLQQRLLLGAVLYLVLVAAAFVYLAWLKREAQKIAVQYAAAQPQLEQVAAQQRRWNDLRLAIDPRFYSVEILYLAHRNLPTEDVRITEFMQNAGKWTIVGEAPSVNLAIEYAEKLKVEKDLEPWTIVSAPPAILKGEQARFSIEGRP
jgi:hypothetical protein